MTTALEERNPGAGQVGFYLRTLRRRWWLILLLTAITTAAAVALTMSQEKQYDASADVLLTEREPITTFINPNAEVRSNDPEREVNTKIALIRLDSIARSVRRELGLSISTKDLLEKVRTEAQGNSNLVSIIARDKSPEQARRLANSFADNYEQFRRESARASLNEAAGLAEERLASLSDEERASTEGRALAASLQQLQIAAAGQTGGVEVVRRADTPTSAATPRPLRTGAIALVLGLLLATGLTLLLQLLDRRLHDEESVESFFNLPVLSTVPRARKRSAGRVPGDDPGQHEAYAALATNLRFFEFGDDVSSVIITSPGPGEGKTSVTLGTARALATLSQRVLAIEADMRRPTFGSYGLQSTEHGLSTVLAGRSALEEALVRVNARTFEPTMKGEGAGEDASFWVLPAGPIPPNPQGLLSRGTLPQLLEHARSIADVVLVDVPPIGSVNDPVTVASYVDGVVLIARLNKTTRDDARRSLRVLGNLDTPVLGVVMTDAETSADGYYARPDDGGISAAKAAAATPSRRGELAPPVELP